MPHLGVRGRALLILAAFWALNALAIALGIGQDGPWPHLMIPAWIREAGWLGSALFAAFSAFRTRARWAFGALFFMPAMQVGSFASAWVTWLILGGDNGDPRGWYRALLFVGMILAVWVLAGIHERPEAAPREAGRCDE